MYTSYRMCLQIVYHKLPTDKNETKYGWKRKTPLF